MPIQKVSDIEGEPVVGKFYLVLCVAEIGTMTGWRPIIGPCHDDVEHLNFPQRHWHYDHRFTSEEQLDEMGLDGEPIERAFAFVASEKRVLFGPTLKRKKCRRQMPDFPPVKRVAGTLEAAYGKANAKCGRCPHRGFDLKSLPVKEDGTVICPGHGLRWNVETGEMVPRC